MPHPAGRADREARPLLGERGHRGPHEHVEVLAAVAQQRAELVASHPVGGTVRGDHGAQLVGQARQQRVAGGVPEGVVVALEAIQVVEHVRSHVSPAARAAAGDLEVLHQQPAVADAGERVGQRQASRAGEHRDVLAHRRRQVHAHREHGRRREHQGGWREPGVEEVAVDQHPQRGEQRERGHGHQAPVLHPPPPRPRPGRPGGERQQHRGERPQALRPVVRPVGVGGRLVEVRRVGHRRDRQAGGEQQPHPPRAPPGHGERAERERQQQQVADRVSERHPQRGGDVPRARCDRIGGKATALHPPGGRRPADQPVQPDRDAGLMQVRRQQQHERDVAAGVERQVQHVGWRESAAAGRAGAFQEEDVVEVAEPPARQARAHRQPGRALGLRTERAAGEHCERGAAHQRAVDALDPDQPFGPVVPEAEGGVASAMDFHSAQEEGIRTKVISVGRVRDAGWDTVSASAAP